MNNYFTTIKKYSLYLKPNLNSLSLFLGILLFGFLGCSLVLRKTKLLIPDTEPPTVTISTNESLEKDITGTITFTFSEKVINFTPGDIQLLMNETNIDNGSFSNKNNQIYYLKITPKTTGTLTITILSNSFEDLSGNQNTDIFSSSFSVVEDKTPPTVTISTNESLKKGIPGTITFTFSEEVKGFAPDDIQLFLNQVSVDKGSLVTGDQKNYFLEITPKTTGTLTIVILSNSFYDLSGNQNTDIFSSSFSVVEDNIPPTVAISTKENLEIGKTGTITFTFSENVTNFTKNDVQLSSSDFPVNEITIGNFTTNNSKEYSLKITPKLSGTLTITIPANSFYDLSGNQNTNNFSNSFWIRENIPPTVTIHSETLIKGKSASLSFIFSENVNNFTPDDIQFLPTGFSLEKGKFVTNSQESYSLRITPKETGSLGVSIPAKSFEDLSGNQNDKTYSSNFTVLDSSTTIHTISFKLNGGSFISPQITNLKVVSNEAIEETKLGGILSYPPTGPKPNIEAVTRGIFEWQTTNGTKYDFSTLVSSDLTLEAVWSNSCGKVETFHPADRNDLKTYTDAAVGANATTNLNHIDTSTITDMYQLFYDKFSFNGEIGCWNTAKVTNMQSMFDSANAFNQDISTWNVANVTDMSSMFEYATVFDQDISKWSVNNVTKYNNMFTGSPMESKTSQQPSFP